MKSLLSQVTLLHKSSYTWKITMPLVRIKFNLWVIKSLHTLNSTAMSLRQWTCQKNLTRAKSLMNQTELL